jgi:DNA-binding CsgD family transcriptional regulator
MSRPKKSKPASRSPKKRGATVVNHRPAGIPAAPVTTLVALPAPVAVAIVPAEAPAQPARPRGWDRLTPAQRSVLRLIAAGRTTNEIAVELGASPHTVQAHRGHLSVRLGLRGRNALQRFAEAHPALF